jgi:hypothetical protein
MSGHRRKYRRTRRQRRDYRLRTAIWVVDLATGEWTRDRITQQQADDLARNTTSYELNERFEIVRRLA